MKLEMNADAFRRRPAMRRSVSPLTGAGAHHAVAGPPVQPDGLRGGLYLYASDGFSRADLDGAGAQCPASGGAY